LILLEVVRDLASLDEAFVIYAAEPFTENSEVILVPDVASGSLPMEMSGLRYFLEVSIAREFIEGWLANLDKEPTPGARCARLIEYAYRDA